MRTTPRWRRRPSGLEGSSRDGRSGTSTRPSAAAGSPRCCAPSFPTCEAPGSIPAGWSCAEQSEFFELTKRLHNNLHGDDGDDGELGPRERELYDRDLADSGRHLAALVEEGDIVFLHDPQTAGLVEAAKGAGATVIWRCHVGADDPDELVRRAWSFLLPYVSAADAYVFSRRDYVWDVLDPDRASVMPPSIDPISPKNQDLDGSSVLAIVGAIGLGEGGPARCAHLRPRRRQPRRASSGAPTPSRRPRFPTERALSPRSRAGTGSRTTSGCSSASTATSTGRISISSSPGRRPPPSPTTPRGPRCGAKSRPAWHDLAADVRGRVHLVNLPMEDTDENAAMVNALQRRAEIVVQKSIAEGFGLTVAEAMWKRRPVIGTRVGGIQDQIVDRESGLLVDDPRDLEALAGAIRFLADDPRNAEEIGERARERVRETYLSPIRLAEYVDLLARIDQGGAR